MKLDPKRNQILGRVVLSKRPSSKISLLDETKGVTKFVLIDAVSPEAAAAGYQVGDIVLPRAMNSLFLNGGAFFRALVDVGDILATLSELGPTDELSIQDEGGKNFEAFSPVSVRAA
jgi:hypothetical protein